MIVNGKAAEPIFVDSNIPMYVAGRDHPLRDVCTAAMARITDELIEVVTNAEVHQEILHRYLAQGLSEQASAVSNHFQTLVPDVLPITVGDIERARELSAAYPTAHARDLIHVAVMINNHVSLILSADAHFDAMMEVERIAPQNFITWLETHRGKAGV